MSERFLSEKTALFYTRRSTASSSSSKLACAAELKVVYHYRLIKQTRENYGMPPTQSLKSCVVKLTSCRKSDSELVKKDKKVHFADSMGLSLVSVVYLPQSAPAAKLSSQRRWSFCEEKAKLLNFTQPLERRDFIERLNGLNVSLENIVLRDFGLFGTVKVRNLAFQKRLTVRYTIDGWTTYRDVVGQYVVGSQAGFTDTFSFEIGLPTTLIRDCKLEFAVCYKVLGVEFWDNNSGDNYRVMCYSSNQWKSRELVYNNKNSVDVYAHIQNRYVGLRF